MIINIDPVALYIPLPLIGWWPIHWYGITWLLAIFGILWYSKKNVTKKTPFDKNDLDDFLFMEFLVQLLAADWDICSFMELSNYLQIHYLF